MSRQLADLWTTLSRKDQAEALEFAAARTGRPPHLLEKDIWVVRALSAIYESSLADKLTFKGGTSLSKVYKIIDRFSEDIDLTYDIRELVPELLRDGNPIPSSPSQAKKITDSVRARLPVWIESEVIPILQASLERDGQVASLSIDGVKRDKLLLKYEPVKVGTGYVASTVQLEFGGRATGEPHQKHLVTCDIAPVIDTVVFPTATPLVMSAERTFWEKATAAHVYCKQGRLHGERYSRHWYDLYALARSGHAETASADRLLAQCVAEHKSFFFAEKDSEQKQIDYHAAVNGQLCLVPQGSSLTALEQDYSAMLGDGLLAANEPSLTEILAACAQLEGRING